MHTRDRATPRTGVAAKLGALRPFLSTAETVSDLEDLRAALGIDRLALFGVSYGTKVATEYARRYPERTAVVILDSPIYPGGPDIFNRETAARLRARAAQHLHGRLPAHRR